MLLLDKTQVARQFSRAAIRYRQASELQDQMAEKLLSMLPKSLQAQRVVDLGCGTGYLTSLLQQRFPAASVTGLDLASGMIEMARNSQDKNDQAVEKKPDWLVADMENIPLPTASIDLVFSNAALQWTDTKKSLQEIARILEPGGLAYLAVFAQGSLQEWDCALEAAGLSGVHPLPCGNDLEATAEGLNLHILKTGEVTYRIEHGDVQSLIRCTKGMGATNARKGRARGLMGKGTYQKLIDALQEQYSGGDYSSSYRTFFLVLQK